MEDWALIRRLAADGVPKAEIARKLGISRTTVIKAIASQSPPKYERAQTPTSFTPFEVRVRQLLSETPDMPATVAVPAAQILLEDGSRTLSAETSFWTCCTT